VTGQAKADLACGDVTLALKAVHPAGSPNKIGAAGCGKTAVYVPGESGWQKQATP
jgi:hypothetical protein